uniref:Lipoprotein n=1 Tax=uncultured Thiotrichaceae bacterium TaxID=298394 RepID=A0A6S6U0R7_9GAMM|nr:MAG: Unknown protein [uncultured Thiotrichaceae bacterium]
MVTQRNSMGTKLSLITIVILLGFLSACSRGALQGTEKNLGDDFILYYITDTGTRIEYEGKKRNHYTVSSNTVDGFYNNSNYIFIIRNPSDNSKLNGTHKERYYKPCEFFIINKKTHEKIYFSKFIDFEKSLKAEGLHIDNLMFTFDKKDDRSCRKKFAGISK